MSTSILYMSMSLDGFITGPDDGPEQGLGAGGEALHGWFPSTGDGPEDFRPGGPSATVFDEMLASGAVISSRRTYDAGNRWGGDHHDGVPIFIVTRGERPEDDGYELTTYVNDVESAMAQAKEAAGDKTVMVHGANLAQSMFKAGLLDEIEIHLVPLVLGGGRPLFADQGDATPKLEIQRVIEAPDVTHIRYRVL